MENEDFELLLGRVEEHEGFIKALQEDRAHLARDAAQAALELVYAEVGKSVVKAVLWVLGAGCIALFAWLAGTGKVSVK